MLRKFWGNIGIVGRVLELTSSRGFFLTVANALRRMKPNCFSILPDSSVTASKYSRNRSLEQFVRSYYMYIIWVFIHLSLVLL